MTASAWGKVLVGIALVIAGLYVLVPLGPSYPFSGIALGQFVNLLIGVIPPLVVLIGILIVWIEWEELKIEKPVRKAKKRKKR